MKVSALKMFVVAGFIFAASASAQGGTTGVKPPPPSVSTFTDSRDGKSYRAVTIGTQTWMAQNLNYDGSGGACYRNSASNCVQYGRLYDWAAAKEVCPAGWRLPSDADWTTLTDNVGGSPIAGKKFKTKTGWYNNGNGTDESKFSALPGGDSYSDSSFYDLGGSGYWWSATERDANRAWYRSIRCDYEGVGRGYDRKVGRFSVRCLQE